MGATNDHLAEIRDTLDLLYEDTIDSLDLNKIQKAWYGIRRRQWYRENRKRIIQEIRDSGLSLEPGPSNIQSLPDQGNGTKALPAPTSQSHENSTAQDGTEDGNTQNSEPSEEP